MYRSTPRDGGENSYLWLARMTIEDDAPGTMLLAVASLVRFPTSEQAVQKACNVLRRGCGKKKRGRPLVSLAILVRRIKLHLVARTI